MGLSPPAEMAAGRAPRAGGPPLSPSRPATGRRPTTGASGRRRAGKSDERRGVDIRPVRERRGRRPAPRDLPDFPPRRVRGPDPARAVLRPGLLGEHGQRLRLRRAVGLRSAAHGGARGDDRHNVAVLRREARAHPEEDGEAGGDVHGIPRPRGREAPPAQQGRADDPLRRRVHRHREMGHQKIPGLRDRRMHRQIRFHSSAQRLLQGVLRLGPGAAVHDRHDLRGDRHQHGAVVHPEEEARYRRRGSAATSRCASRRPRAPRLRIGRLDYRSDPRAGERNNISYGNIRKKQSQWCKCPVRLLS